MKYHNNFSVISISILMLVIFSLVVVMCSFVYTISSPTEYLTNSILESINLSEDFDISFSSIDRGIGHKIVINDLVLESDGNKIATLETITLYQGIPSILKSILTGKGHFEIEGSFGDINITNDFISNLNFESSGEDNTSSDNIFSKYTYSFLLKNINVKYDDLISIDNLSASGNIDKGFNISSITAKVDNIKYKDEVLVTDTQANIINKENNDFLITLNSKNASVDMFDINADVFEIKAETTINLNDIDLMKTEINLSFDKLLLDYMDMHFDVAKSSFSFIDGKLNTVFNSIDAKYQDYQAKTKQIQLDLTYKNERVDIDFKHLGKLSILENKKTIGSISAFSILGYYDESLQVYLDAEFIDIPFLSDYLDGVIEKTNIEKLRFNISSDLKSIDLSGEMKGLIEVKHEIIDQVSSNIILDAKYDFNKGIENLDISLPSITIGKFESTSRLNAKLTDNDNLELSLKFANSLSLDVVLSDVIDMDLQFLSFNIGSLSPLIDYYVPFLSNYVSKNTVLNGALLIDGVYKNQTIPFNGDINYSLALSNIKFNNNSFGFASTLSSKITESEFDISSFAITTEWVRLGYNGKLSFESFLPEGILRLNMTDSGDELFKIDFSLSENKEYLFNANIPYFDPALLTGNVNWATDNIISFSGLFKTSTTDYPFKADLDLLNKDGSFNTSGLLISLDYTDDLLIDIDFDNFTFINENTENNGLIDGDVNFSFNFVDQDFEVKSSVFSIENFGFSDISSKLKFEIDVDSSQARVKNIELSDIYNTLSGELLVNYSDFNLAFYLKGLENDEKISLSLVPFNDFFSGTLELKNINVERVGLSNAVLNSTLLGFGRTLDEFRFSGNFNISSTDEINYPLSINSSIEISATDIILSSLYYKRDNLSISSDSLSYSALTGILESDITFDMVMAHKDRDYPVNAKISLLSNTGEFTNLYDGIVNTLFERDFPLSLNIGIEIVNIDNDHYIKDKTISILENENGGAVIEGNFINGNFNLGKKTLDINIVDNEILQAHIFGSFDNDNFKIEAEDVSFELSLINYILSAPIFGFYKGSTGHGNIILHGPLSDFRTFGEIYLENGSAYVWFLPNQVIEIHNGYMSLWDNTATTSEITGIVYDKDKLELNRFTGTFGAQLSASSFFESYQLSLSIPEGDEITVRFPLIGMNIDIIGDTHGTFNLYSDLKYVDMNGELFINDFTLSIGLHPYEDWVRVIMPAKNEYTVTIGDNCKFIFPLGDDPIMTAYFKEGAVFGLKQDSLAKTLSFSGELPFRSGEFFYFQKNFYITEGSLAFDTKTNASDSRIDQERNVLPDIANSNSNGINPIINLRARLRDFDSNNEKVDIYLNLINATLSTISPIFESSPQKDTEEILSILGESILPSDAYGEVNASSIASLLTTGFDAISRLGIIQTNSNGLTDSIRTSLGLDVFSLHTSIFENIITDTLQLNSSQAANISPLARYLNNTTAYIGKYLSDQFYLQGLLHLSAITDSNESTNVFLASDLAIDIELSLEWINQMGVFTIFTQPKNFSLFDIMDSFGFSFSKRITF